MDIAKLNDAYAYLRIKGLYKFESIALKMLWLADKQHYIQWGRTVSGCDLSITDLPWIDIDDSRPLRECFQQLSTSDCLALDEAFKTLSSMSDEQIAAFLIKPFASMEEVFEDVDPEEARIMLEYIRENEALRKAFPDPFWLK
jgi:hypothetical protein